MENDYFFADNIGDPISRVDGPDKVTGKAKYAAEYDVAGVHYASLVLSTIAKGKIKRIETRDAEKAPGVIAVITHKNAPKIPGYSAAPDNHGSRVYGQEFRVFYNEDIQFNQQPVAIVVADTLERAEHAASLVQVDYNKDDHETNLETNLAKAIKPERGKDYTKGIPDAYKSAAVSIEQTYITPIQVHNPMETHSVTVVWQGNEKVTVYNKTQAVKISQKDIMKAFELKEENVHVISPFVGGAFGSSSRVWPQEMATLMAGKVTGKPVKLMLKRDQVFNMVGYRPQSVQKVGIGASISGLFTGITHEALGTTSTYEQFTERIVDPTKTMYACPNLNTTYRLVPLDLSTPCWTRGPGETSGSFALESAVDELAEKLKIDPLQLRLINYAEKDPEKNKPWSSNQLKACYEQGAKAFGWSKRNPAPRSMMKNGMLVGMGMASGIYKSERSPASASASIDNKGNIVVQTSVADVGPGSATIMTQIAAETLDVDFNKVKFEWGNSMYPEAPGQFGSHTTASTGSAIYKVCTSLINRLKQLATGKPGTPFERMNDTDLVAEKGMIYSKDRKSKMSFTDVLKQHNLPQLKVTEEAKAGPETEEFSTKSFCANFVEVHVDPLTGMVKINKVVSAVDSGQMVNIKTATSQVYGSIVWGIGIALMEDAVVDHRYGRHITKDLADYHVPTNADVPDIQVIFTGVKDTILDPMGAKGLGEIPLVGFTAAVANAVYHATGKRIRELPITPDKLV